MYSFNFCKFEINFFFFYIKAIFLQSPSSDTFKTLTSVRSYEPFNWLWSTFVKVYVLIWNFTLVTDSLGSWKKLHLSRFYTLIVNLELNKSIQKWKSLSILKGCFRLSQCLACASQLCVLVWIEQSKDHIQDTGTIAATDYI